MESSPHWRRRKMPGKVVQNIASSSPISPIVALFINPCITSVTTVSHTTHFVDAIGALLMSTPCAFAANNASKTNIFSFKLINIFHCGQRLHRLAASRRASAGRRTRTSLGRRLGAHRQLNSVAVLVVVDVERVAHTRRLCSPDAMFARRRRRRCRNRRRRSRRRCRCSCRSCRCRCSCRSCRCRRRRCRRSLWHWRQCVVLEQSRALVELRARRLLQRQDLGQLALNQRLVVEIAPKSF